MKITFQLQDHSNQIKIPQNKIMEINRKSIRAVAGTLNYGSNLATSTSMREKLSVYFFERFLIGVAFRTILKIENEDR